MILNTGEVPNLFVTEEKTEILERVQVKFHRCLIILKCTIFEANIALWIRLRLIPFFSSVSGSNPKHIFYTFS